MPLARRRFACYGPPPAALARSQTRTEAASTPGGRAAQLGRGESLLREIGALDEAVEAARRFAGEDALIIVAGLANTGGLQLNAFSFAPDRGIAVLSPSTAGVPALSWSTAPAPWRTVRAAVLYATGKTVEANELAATIKKSQLRPEERALLPAD